MTQEVLETILNDPCFIEAVYEALRNKQEPPPKEDEGTAEDEVIQRIRNRISFRLKQRNAKRQRL